MTILTIPKEYKNKNLVLVPQDEYEQLVEFRAAQEEIELSPAGKRALARARKNFHLGKTMSVHELKRKLGY